MLKQEAGSIRKPRINISRVLEINILYYGGGMSPKLYAQRLVTSYPESWHLLASWVSISIRHMNRWFNYDFTNVNISIVFFILKVNKKNWRPNAYSLGLSVYVYVTSFICWKVVSQFTVNYQGNVIQ